ncbi:GNAT family N-acetyltransferase [Nonomuraea sp. NPDC050153]|uniref:GNAT family N-acetyltransferase n=1 Tax=Nonomuraea sp. NPDC050153 TaxID=3364359 RepID=UPI003798FADD
MTLKKDEHTMPDTWITRPETPQDIPAIRQVALGAFPTPLEADLIEALRIDAAWSPELSILAQAPDGAVAGYALLTRCHVGTAPALALGPCAVLPQYQRQGAGSAAIRAGLRAARDKGENLVLVLGHPEYYPRFGFTPASAYGIRPSFDVPDEAMMALVFDATLPVPGGTIVYPAPFGV